MKKDYQTYDTRRDCVQAIKQLQGWGQAKPIKIAIEDGGTQAEKWVLQINGYLYMRNDGFVR